MLSRIVVLGPGSRGGSWRACALALLFVACRREDPGAAIATATAPERSPQWVSVTVSFEAADGGEDTAEQIEQLVAGVPGVTAMRTEVSDTHAITWIAFEADVEGEPVTAVQAAVGAGLRSLPPSAVPVVQRHASGEADAWLLVRSRDHSAIELAAVAESVRSDLMTQPGVRDVRYCGPRACALLEIDGARLEALGLVATDALAGLRAAGLEPGLSPEQLLELPFGEARGRDFMTMRLDAVGSCSVTTNGAGTGIALRLRYHAESDIARAIAARVDETRARLPPGVGLDHEPLVDAPTVQPRVRVRAPQAAAYARLSWPSEAARAWLVADEDGRAQIVGLADATVASSVARALSSSPGLLAVAEVEPWVSLALFGDDTEQLAARAARTVDVLARAGTPTWRALPGDAPEIDIRIDRVRAATLGVDATAIADTIALHTSEGIVIGRLAGDARLDVVLRVPTNAPGPAPWLGVRVRGTAGIVPLDALVEVTQDARPAVRERCNRRRCIAIDVPAAAARELDLAALGRDVELLPGETLAIVPRPP